jgi:colanic acid/amylovoran biosynthesis protein
MLAPRGRLGNAFRGPKLRILVEPSDYIIRNIGDTAMMTVALERLGKLWPNSRIQVLTDKPGELPRPSKNVEPLCLDGRKLWFEHRWWTEEVTARHSRRGLAWPKRKIRRSLRRTCPTLSYHAFRRWAGLSANEIAHLSAFFDAISGSDFVVVTGMGGITSAFPKYAHELLEVVRSAQRLGAKTAMLGQGLGPIEDPELRKEAGATFRRLDVLALREKRASLPLLRTLNVPIERTFVTGDDAVEIGISNATGEVGNGIGINMRFADYAAVSHTDVEKVGQVVRKLSKQLGAPLIGVPISRVPGEEDAVTIAALIDDNQNADADLASIHLPDQVVRQLHRCRLLVAGSYHAGVFALSCGIPTIALVRSPYYLDKFLGLADMFGTGCHVIRVDELGFPDALEAAICKAWCSAEAVRGPLLAAAQSQLRQGTKVYASLKELFR